MKEEASVLSANTDPKLGFWSHAEKSLWGLQWDIWKLSKLSSTKVCCIWPKVILKTMDMSSRTHSSPFLFSSVLLSVKHLQSFCPHVAQLVLHYWLGQCLCWCPLTQADNKNALCFAYYWIRDGAVWGKDLDFRNYCTTDLKSEGVSSKRDYK